MDKVETVVQHNDGSHSTLWYGEGRDGHPVTESLDEIEQNLRQRNENNFSKCYAIIKPRDRGVIGGRVVAIYTDSDQDLRVSIIEESTGRLWESWSITDVRFFNSRSELDEVLDQIQNAEEFFKP